MLNQIEYYKNNAVRNRIFEFINNAEYIVGYGESEVSKKNPKGHYSAPPSHLYAMMDRGLDIFSSMLGHDGTLISLDIEYYNSKSPGEVYLNADNVFRNKIEPVREIVKSVYKDFGIRYLEVITGQGYHYHSLWQLRNEHWQLEKIGKLEQSLEYQYLNREKIRGQLNVPLYIGLGYSGAFRLLQFATLEIMRRVYALQEKDKNIISLQYCDIEMSPPEGVSLDLTIYSDSIYMRAIRVPFSTHQKHKVKKEEIGEHISSKVPVQIALPTGDLSLIDILKMRRNFKMASEYANDSKSSCIVPDASNGWLNVLAKYKSSELYEFHKKFDSVEYEQGIDDLNFNEFPPCITHGISNPDPHLKKPTNIRTVIAILRKKGYDYKHIAGFFYKKYKNLPEFSINKYNAETRANFFVQLYGAAIYLGLDRLPDLNCISYQEKKYCIQQWCGHNLELWR
ncbi:MAG: hypothetical protein PHE88_03940 [Elusimicrobia bacterium]|nr:hypothetical protein [Elusimicrobiota bacterium]